jgi:uncharacterized membrane protein YccC
MSWLKETFHIYLQWMAGGVATIPVGFVYALFSLHKHDSLWIVLPTLAVGLACFSVAFKWVGKKLQ